jgi:hypothetical protein
VDDNETFTRLIYFGTTQLGFSMDDVWFMPVGLLLDLAACHKQFLGIEKPVRHLDLDDLIP